MTATTKNLPIVLSLVYALVVQPAIGSTTQKAPWVIKKDDVNVCVAQSLNHPGMLLETKKLTIPLKEMSGLRAYKVTINDQVALPLNKPNLVDTSCNCIRVRNMDILKADELNVRIDGVTNKDLDVSITMQIKGIPQALQGLQADNCRKTEKNLAGLSVRQ